MSVELRGFERRGAGRGWRLEVLFSCVLSTDLIVASGAVIHSRF